jgi:hypothetical protein
MTIEVMSLSRHVQYFWQVLLTCVMVLFVLLLNTTTQVNRIVRGKTYKSQ